MQTRCQGSPCAASICTPRPQLQRCMRHAVSVQLLRCSPDAAHARLHKGGCAKPKAYSVRQPADSTCMPCRMVGPSKQRVCSWCCLPADDTSMAYSMTMRHTTLIPRMHHNIVGAPAQLLCRLRRLLIMGCYRVNNETAGGVYRCFQHQAFNVFIHARKHGSTQALVDPGPPSL